MLVSNGSKKRVLGAHIGLLRLFLSVTGSVSRTAWRALFDVDLIHTKFYVDPPPLSP